MKKEQHAHRVTEGLKAIYGEQSDDLHVVERGKTPLQRWVAALVKISLIACLIVVGITGFVIRKTWLAPTDPAVTVTAAWEGEIVTGQEVTLDIRYANPLRRPLANVAFDINLPPGFRLTEALPAPTDVENIVWHIGSLGRASDGQIRLRGIVEAAPGAVFPAQIVTTFRPSNFNADFSQVTSVNSEVGASVYTLMVDPITSIFPGEGVTYRLTVSAPATAQAGTAERPLVVEVIPPPTFRVEKTNPEALTDGAYRLPVTLKDGQGIAEVTGMYTADATGTQQWSARIREERVESVLIHAEQAWATDVRTDGIAISVVGNGDTSSTDTSRGKSVRLSIRLKNTSTQVMRADAILLDFQPGSGVPISWATATLDGGVVTREGIRYALNADLAPGEERTLNPSFPIRTDVRAGDQQQFTVTARLTAGDRTSATAPFTMRLIDVPELSLEALPVAGPNPPVVGQGTTYAVTVTVPATAADISNLEVTGVLPAGVTFGGVTDGAWSPTYNQANRSLQLVATSKPANQELTVTFTVIAIPGPADVGTALPLWRELILRGRDSQNAADFTAPQGALTVEGPARP